jgi:hypothetical protein
VSVIDTENARIVSADIALEDRGGLQYALELSGAGWGTVWAGPAERGALLALLELVGVTRWRDLVGRYVRVRTNYPDVLAIGHIIDDRWIDRTGATVERAP